MALDIYIDLPLRSVGSISAPGLASEATLQALLDELELKANLTDTQPVSGSFTITDGATETKQDDQIAQLADIQIAVENIETKTPALGQALSADSTPVVLPASQIVALTPPAAIAGFSLELTQQDVKAAVESLDTKLPAQGQALAAASMPVVLTAAQIATLTPPAAITGFATELTLAAQSAKLPATLGSKADATSLAVTQSTEDKAAIGALTETAPATDTASSGLNGRLQRIAQRITSLIALLPAALGQGTMAQSLKVVLPSDQSTLSVTLAPPTVASTDDSSAAVDSTTGVTFTKPANAKNMVIFNNAADVDTQPSTNANRIRIGQAPSWSTGDGGILSPGGSTALLPAATFKALAENATNANVTVMWFY